MVASSYYEKALANFKTAKIIVSLAPNDEEQLNQAAYHLQQALELAIKHIFCIKGLPLQKTHDIDQLIVYARDSGVDLYLPDYFIQKAEMISNWESKTRYVLGFKLELEKIRTTIDELQSYFEILSKKLKY
mgnify:CR=1 FL=1